jgi:hypothetical protein
LVENYKAISWSRDNVSITEIFDRITTTSYIWIRMPVANLNYIFVATHSGQVLLEVPRAQAAAQERGVCSRTRSL